MRNVMLVGLLILLASCGATGGAGCEAWRPILMGDDDQISAETGRAILAHNLTGRRRCGW